MYRRKGWVEYNRWWEIDEEFEGDYELYVEVDKRKNMNEIARDVKNGKKTSTGCVIIVLPLFINDCFILIS